MNLPNDPLDVVLTRLLFTTIDDGDSYLGSKYKNCVCVVNL